MRSILIAIAISVASQAGAWEFSRNPDRFPSIGLRVENYRASGALTSISNPNPPMALVEHGNAQDDYIGLGANLRLPATESLTLELDYMNIDGESIHSRNNNIYRESSNLNGYRTSFGFRLYLNK